MKITLLTLLIIICSTVIMRADKTKYIERKISAVAGQKIEIMGLSSASVSVKSWDKLEVYIKVTVKVSASDEDDEALYIDSMKIVQTPHPTNVAISIHDKIPQESDDQFNLFGLKFGSYFKKEITVEVYLPNANSVTLSAKYCTLSADGIRSELHLLGKSNTLTFSDCISLKDISNDYGSTAIQNSKGKLQLAGKSSSIKIQNYDDYLNIEAPYSSVRLSALGAGVGIKSKSGTIDISNSTGDILIEAQYATMNLSDIKGQVTISSKSASISIKNSDRVTVNADYSTIDCKQIRASDSTAIIINDKSGTIRIDEASGKVEIDAPHSKIGIRKISGDVGIITQSGKISASELTGKLNVKADHTTIIARSLDVTSVWINGKSNSIEIACNRLPKNTVILNDDGTTSMKIATGFSGMLNLEATHGRIETNLQLDGKNGATIFRGAIGSSSETITITSGIVRLFQL